MFNAYEYLSTIAPEIPAIKKTYKVSGLSALEEVLSDIHNNPDCCLVVRDSGDGHLDLKSRRLNNAYHTIYIMVKAKLNDHESRLSAKRNAMATGIALFDRMKLDAFDYGNAAFGFDSSRIDYSEIGPLGSQYYGYSFGFSMEHDV